MKSTRPPRPARGAVTGPGGPAASRPAGPDRRERIASGLDRCIRKRGYAASTLSEIAAAAGMSPSHVHYYFDGKAAILAYHFENLCENLLEAVRPFASAAPRAQIEALTNLFFGDPRTSPEAVGVYLEIFGVAVHSDRVRATKTRWDREMRRYFQQLFALAPRAAGLSAETAAELAFALLMGLRTNAYFDDSRDLASARELFRAELLRLAGFAPAPSPSRPAPDAGSPFSNPTSSDVTP